MSNIREVNALLLGWCLVLILLATSVALWQQGNPVGFISGLCAVLSMFAAYVHDNAVNCLEDLIETDDLGHPSYRNYYSAYALSRIFCPLFCLFGYLVAILAILFGA